ncbi:2-dehydropantoate 2-reductase [Bradyrhizobium sp. LB1.3]
MRSGRHILVVGNGSIAGYLLGALSSKSTRENLRVTALATERSAPELRLHGLRIEAKDFSLRCRPNILVNPNDVSDVDMIIIAARAECTRSALSGLKAVMQQGATVVLATSGFPWWLPAANSLLKSIPIEAVDPDGMLLSSTPIGNIVSGIFDLACDRPAPGFVRHYRGRTLTIGSAMPGSLVAAEVQQLLSNPWLDCIVDRDIRSKLWSKLINTGSINPIRILTGVSPNDIASSGLGQSLSISAMREIEKVGMALGFGPFADPERRLRYQRDAGCEKTSLMHEIEYGLDLELDATIAAIIEIGLRIGIPTPTLSNLREIARHKAMPFQHVTH